jgi:hypothetical protein
LGTRDFVNPTLLLRIASIITLLFALGHSLGAPWTPVNDAAPAAVVEAMKSVSFDALGSKRTYWDFYFGFGVSISVYLFVQAALTWLLASLARTQSGVVRPFVVVLLVGSAATVYFIWKYFFVIPLVLSCVLLVVLALALMALRPRVGV